jgi:hypothetical protein
VPASFVIDARDEFGADPKPEPKARKPALSPPAAAAPLSARGNGHGGFGRGRGRDEDEGVLPVVDVQRAHLAAGQARQEHGGVRALQDARSLWPGARAMLVALSAPAVVSLPAGIEVHRASTWLLEAEPTMT